jgi:NAD(P)-dependent dehydrogenase (short-subunit alcohol dehydrogenase family)
MNEKARLSGTVALVTGGAHRVGKALAMALADAGADVIVHYYRSAEEAAVTASEIQALGRRVTTLAADLSRISEIERLFQAVQRDFGQLDILINSAAFFEPVDFLSMTAEQWDRTLGVNLRAPTFCAQSAARLMHQGGEGHIINIADVIGLRPWPRYPHHSIAKAGLMMLTQVLAVTLAPTIRVNAVAPGPVLKPPLMSDERWQAIGDATLVGRTGRPSDVAAAVLFLVQSEYITGEVLVVDGGSRFVT